MKTEIEQKDDDAFRDKLLGTKCFCGAEGGYRRATLVGFIGNEAVSATVQMERTCAPLKCLAYGYCEAHMTPVAAQMSEDDKTRVMKRAGWMQG